MLGDYVNLSVGTRWYKFSFERFNKRVDWSLDGPTQSTFAGAYYRPTYLPLDQLADIQRAGLDDALFR